MRLFQRINQKSLALKIGVMLLTAGLVWFGFSFWKNTKSSAPQYQTAKAEKGTLISSVSASGSVTTSNVQEVTTQATGGVQ